MRWLLFLSRLAFICGLFFLLTISLLVKEWIKDDNLISTVITIGFFMGIIVVPITVVCYLVIWIIGKSVLHHVPRWLVISNFMVLLMLLGYIIYINYLYAQV